MARSEHHLCTRQEKHVEKKTLDARDTRIISKSIVNVIEVFFLSSIIELSLNFFVLIFFATGKKGTWEKALDARGTNC